VAEGLGKIAIRYTSEEEWTAKAHKTAYLRAKFKQGEK